MAPVAFSAPDGGYGWMIVFSSFFIHFMCNGLTLAMGVLCVSWYQEFDSTKTETSWVVSVNVAVMLAMGPFASGLAARMGYRAMAVTGACFITVGSLLSSMASSINGLMLTIGVIGGIGGGMCYLPAVAVPAFYFEKRRSLAMGLGTAGIGGGMFLLAPVINWLIAYYGWRGTMVILAGFSFNLCVAGALMRPLDALSRPRATNIAVRYPNSEAASDTESLVQPYTKNDPMRELKLKLGRITLDSNSESESGSGQSSQEPPLTLTDRIQAAIMGQLRLLQDTTFLLFALSNFLTNLSIVMPAVFMVDRAVSEGLGSEFASLLVSLNGAGTIAGRVAIAVIADHPRMNRLVAYMAVLVLAGAITCLSPICGSSMLLHGFYACSFGILIGNYGALCPCVMVDLKGLDAVGESYGMLLMFMGISNLMGAPVGGILYDFCGSFSPPFVLHGLFLVASGLIVLPLLCRQAKK
ncbi:hypothetical protein EGW08_022020 [Elysia chlorotica]|uniref:Major facilitator superfamily (MFS) profile domain-containing protein n=1 Tax=Elysia chlorotica TaxID=188477 RepID=A0A3S1H1B7_ELYCH|nr:hypothetical protein EGW08_022020 [Elysia chlorotica]